MHQDAFDPDSLLDGFHAKLAASRRKIDLKHILDGWKADPTGAGLRQDSAAVPLPQPAFAPGHRWRAGVTDVTDVVDISDLGEVLLAARGAEADAATALEERAGSIDLGANSRARQVAADPPDLDAVCTPALRAAAEAAAVDGPKVPWAALPPVAALQGRRDPRVLSKWAPGAWLGSFKPVCDATAEFLASPHGPVVETYPPQMLLALWAPKAGDDGPLIGHWPEKALLAAAPATGAEFGVGASLLEHLPPDATVWLGAVDADWALVAELVLHHEPALRPFQLKALRGFADAERQAVFERLNNGYARPEPGQPVQVKR